MSSLKYIIEAALLVSSKPLTQDDLLQIFGIDEMPDKSDVNDALYALINDYASRPLNLVEVGGGFRFQIQAMYSPWISRLWQDKPTKYSRAMLETLALIAYKQPITRAEIEEIRGVAVSSQIIKTLSERDWISVIGRRDVPGKPALWGSTTEFLNYFNLKSLNELPALNELRDLGAINRELDLGDVPIPADENTTVMDLTDGKHDDSIREAI